MIMKIIFIIIRRKNAMKKLFLPFAALSLMLLCSIAMADEKHDTEIPAVGAPAGNAPAQANEIRELRERLERLEQKMNQEKEATDELGHRLHPIHSRYGLKISGGITVTAQGNTHAKTGPHRGAAAISGDLALESPVGEDGRVAAVFDVQMGAGLNNLPLLSTQPNGNPTGPNNDIESFNNDALHLAQIYYEHNVNKKLTLTAGKLDPTAYFDANAYANTERSQFLANLFANNPAIEFGGTADFYGPGIRATWKPEENLDITLGAFEGDGDFVNAFDSPFVMAETDVRLKPGGKEGNYRFYVWERHGRPNEANTANPNDARLARAVNRGAGMSLDQPISGLLGVWLRAGVQREKVAQFDSFLGAGLNFSGAIPNRPHDTAGFGYGADFMGKDYREFKKASSPLFRPGAEHYIEAYYNIAVGNATDITGVHVSPDVQYVINPGGDLNQNKLFVYGVRLQAFF